MAFRQVRDLLLWVVEFHEQLGAQYRHLASQQQDERMKNFSSSVAPFPVIKPVACRHIS